MSNGTAHGSPNGSPDGSANGSANRAASGNDHAAAGPSESDEVTKWTESLPIVRITRWGGVISTPDDFLEELLWKALKDVQCPSSIIKTMIENCHEKRWPGGLKNLETRQLSRYQYKNYICREILFDKAVVIMHYENRHMPENMVLEPGIVMALAYGIE